MEKKEGKISASMMCSDLVHLKENIGIFERENIEYLHIDVMDGSFVPNLGLGRDYINGLRAMTNIPLDIHLMVESPEYKAEWLNITDKDMVSIHCESTVHINRALEKVKIFGCKTFLAINPATPIYVIEESLEYIDGVNVLMVNPGFAGQKMVHNCIKKVEKIKHYISEQGHPDLIIEVDGNISCENAKLLRMLGADIFVAGTSSIFEKEKIVSQDRIDLLRQAIK